LRAAVSDASLFDDNVSQQGAKGLGDGVAVLKLALAEIGQSVKLVGFARRNVDGDQQTTFPLPLTITALSIAAAALIERAVEHESTR